jgi:hypothetical protein
MLSKFFCAAAIVVLSAQFARAQVNDISKALPDSAGYGFNLTPFYERPITAQDMRDMEIDRKYRDTLAKIPNKKASRDPWAGVRPATAEDRHRPQ